VADRTDIAELFALYAWGIDSAQFHFTRGTFTDDAHFALQVLGEPAIEPIDGGDAIVDFITQTTLAQTDQRRHFLTNVHLEDDSDDAATAFAYLSLMVTDAGELRHRRPASTARRPSVARPAGALR
jgi:hypothetical protein